MISIGFSIVFSFLILGSNASGEFTILKAPDSLKFSGTSRALESLLKEIFSASLGLSVEENSEWNGLSIVDPFNTPEAVVEVYIDGISGLGKSPTKSIVYPLTVDEYEPDTYEALKHRIKQRYSNGGNKLVNIKLSSPDQLTSYPEVFGDIKPKVTKQTLQHLKYSVEEDYQFLSELEALKAIIAKVKSGAISADNIVDFYNFRFQSLHALSDFHGPNSLATKEAKKLLSETLEELSEAFVKAYNESVMVTVVTTDVAHTRRAVRAAPNAPYTARQSRQKRDPPDDPPAPSDSAPPNSDPSDGNKPDEQHDDDSYSADYAAIFNIILWFGVVFAFALISIVYAIMDMDPGRDSIIYRMTSNRMKKDN